MVSPNKKVIHGVAVRPRVITRHRKVLVALKDR